MQQGSRTFNRWGIRQPARIAWLGLVLVFPLACGLETGALFEGWVLTLLRAYAAERELYDDIHYWSPTQARRTEVDFLLSRGAELLALEVKSSRRFSRSWLSGLKAIGELDRVVRRVIVYLGSERLRTDEGIEVWPLELFLEQLEAGSLWP